MEKKEERKKKGNKRFGKDMWTSKKKRETNVKKARGGIKRKNRETKNKKD